MSVRHAILGLLAHEPRHGYDLHGAFEALVGGRRVWPVNPAQIYTTLSRLEDAGLVVKSMTRRAGGPDRHVFELTEAGREELDRWYGSGTPTTHQRDEVFLKITLSLADDRADPELVIRRQRATLYRDLHELTRRRAGLAPDAPLAHKLLLDKAIMHIEADLRWLEMAEGRLHEMGRQPLPGRSKPRRGRPPGSMKTGMKGRVARTRGDR